MRVCLIGDTHGDATFIANVHKHCREQHVETVVQLGDFGYDFNRNTIHTITAWLDRDPNHKWFWLDGNHDQHDFIEQVLCANTNMYQPINMTGLEYNSVVFPDRMYYMPRGSVVQLGSKRCLAMGGAFSIDKEWRKSHTSWWPQELITGADVERAIANAEEHGEIDVMLSHDGPTSEWLEEKLMHFAYKVDAASATNRRMLSHVVDEVRPQALYHGHYHYRYDATYHTPQGWEVRVHGLGANVEGNYINSTAKEDQNFLILDW